MEDEGIQLTIQRNRKYIKENLNKDNQKDFNILNLMRKLP